MWLVLIGEIVYVAATVAAWFAAYRLVLVLRRVTHRSVVIDFLAWVYLLAGCGMVGQKAVTEIRGSSELALFFLFPPFALLIWFLAALLLTILWPFRWLGPQVTSSPPIFGATSPTVWSVGELRYEMWTSIALAVPVAAFVVVVLRRRDRQLAQSKVRRHERR